jgi:hypothetical protein
MIVKLGSRKLSIWLGWKGKECIHNFGGGTCCKMFLWKTDEEIGR